ncbi:MAG TPA: sugar ABC transporter ATP-binding protein, partial [Bacillales bacterium]|nr:sugar ABC transporter ATP-binding protein [Bacillales bacterium]
METEEKVHKSGKVPLLEAVGISKSYGGVQALDEGDFVCYPGEVHALLGENGAGKSTLVKILCGVVNPDSGVIKVNGRQVEVKSPIEAVELGIVAIFQELSLIPDLSVAENVFLGHEPKTKRGLIDFRTMSRMTTDLFKELELDIPTEILVRDLPLSQQQLVEIAKALSRDPEVIIFDEATSALGKKEVDLLFALIKRLVKRGKTIVFISHRMDEVNQIADTATVYRDARFIRSFQWGSVGSDQIVNWIAGRDLDETFPEKKPVHGTEIALELKGCSYRRKLHNINLSVRKGEILGIAGLQGHGQSEFLQALFGATPFEEGEVKIFGERAALKKPKDAITAGVALVPEDRKNGGLLLPLSVRKNLSLMTLR